MHCKQYLRQTRWVTDGDKNCFEKILKHILTFGKIAVLLSTRTGIYLNFIGPWNHNIMTAVDLQANQIEAVISHYLSF